MTDAIPNTKKKESIPTTNYKGVWLHWRVISVINKKMKKYLMK